MNRTLLLVFVGLLCGYLFLYHSAPHAAVTAGEHRQFITLEMEGAWRYRFLSPQVVNLLTFGNQSDSGIAVAYALAHCLGLPVMFVLLDRWLRLWLSPALSLAGTLLTAVYFPLMLMNWLTQFYSVLEMIFLCAGLWCIVRKPRGWVLAIVVLTVFAALNRETGILIPLAYMALDFTERTTRRYWLLGGAFLLTWAIVYGGLRVVLGNGSLGSVIGLLEINLAAGWYIQTAIINNLFFIPVWLCYFQGFRSAPAPLKRLVPVAALYLALIALFGVWNEVRLFLPLLVFVLPVALPRVAANAQELGASKP